MTRGWKPILLATVVATAAAVVALFGGRAHATPAEAARGVEAEVAAQVRAGLPAGLAIVDVDVPAALVAARGDVTVELRGGLRAGRVSFRVAVTHGKKVRQGWARIELGQLRPVLVARQDLAVGDRLDGGQVTREQRPVAAAQACDLPASALVGARARRAVAAGDLVACQTIERPAPVARGTAIRVVVRRGAVSVAAPGTLEQSARPGELTQARLTNGQRLVRGRLVDGNTFVMEGE